MKTIPTIAITATLLAATTVAQAQNISETFTTNPIGTLATVTGDPSRFSYDSTSNSVLANYDSTLPTAKLLFPLGTTINQNNSFTLTTTFTINSITNYNDTDPTDPGAFLGTAQLSFGLANSVTTGNNRTDGFTGDAYDLVTADYFPTNNSFGTPNLGVTVVESPEAGQQYLDKIDFPSSTNSSLTDFLSTGIPITAAISYDPTTHIVSGTFTATKLTLDGTTTFTSTQDLDVTSLAFDSDGFKGFNLDSFAITLWNDSGSISQGFDVPVSAQLAFQGFNLNVGAPIPEPASLTLLALGSVALIKRRSQKGTA